MDAWYIVETNPQCEKKATGELRRAGMRVYLPHRYKELQHKRTKAPIIKRMPAYTGYLFVRFPDHMFDRRGVPPFNTVRKCQGVKQFLRAMNEAEEWEPFPIPERIVAGIMRRQRAREFGRSAPDRPEVRKARLREKFAQGNEMLIVDGPFEGLLAIVEKLTDSGAVEVEMSIFGRPTRFSFNEPEVSLRAIDANQIAA